MVMAAFTRQILYLMGLSCFAIEIGKEKAITISICPSIFPIHCSANIIAHLVSAADHAEWPQPLSGEASDHVMLETRVRREGGPAVHRAHVGHVPRGLRPLPDVLPVPVLSQIVKFDRIPNTVPAAQVRILTK